MARDQRRTSVVPALIASVAVFAGLAWYMRAVERDAVTVGSAQLAAAIHSPRPIADVAAAVAAMKLVTVEIDSMVRVERGDDNWRGTVQAAVEVPVRLRYGVDMAASDAVRVVYSPISDSPRGMMVVTVPEPVLLGTEVFSAKETVNVKTDGLRLRSRAGEYFLGMARRDVAETARDLVLRAEDATFVRATTRSQVESLVSKLVGDSVLVSVRFAAQEATP